MASDEAGVMLELLEGYKAATSGDPTIEEERAALDAMADLSGPIAGVAVTPTDAGGVPAEWLEPDGARDDRQFVYFHGGGYAIGSLRSHRGFLSRLAEATSTRILSVDYRLAPEDPYPAGLDDAVAATRWAIDRAGDDIDTVIGGDSAGGGLAVATMLRLKKLGAPFPDAAVLLSAWTDLTGSGDSYTERADDDPMIDTGRLTAGVERYLQGAVPADDPYASPLFGDLAGLPPMYVSVGGREVLLDDSTRLAARAQAADVTVKLVVAEEMWHVYPAMAGLLPEADAAVTDIAGWLDATLG